MRLHRAILAPWLECSPLKTLLALAEDPAWERDKLQKAIDEVLEYQPTTDDETAAPPAWLLDILRAVRDGRVEEHPGGGLVLFARDGVSRFAESDLFADDDDLLSASNEEVSLPRHTASVERAVQKMAARCLPDEFLDPLQIAVRWHDAGKLDARFQVLLRHGDELAAISGEPLAKSAYIPTSPARRHAIREASGLPSQFRHEMLSLQLAERYAQLPASNQAVDLLLHLIASHHGHGRPFAPVCLDPEAPPVSGSHDGTLIKLPAEERARLVEPHNLRSGISERFWRLTRRYGWWGLAYLEAVVRLSDWYGSEWILGDGQAGASTPRASPGRAAVAGSIATDEPLVLTALDGANPLGFLAGLGVLAVLPRDAYREVRLGWKRSVTWQAVLSGVSPNDSDSLCEILANELRGNDVSADAEGLRQAAQATFDAAKKAMKDKQTEINTRHLSRKERIEAIKEEVGPLKTILDDQRKKWLEALKEAVPRPELAIGKHIDCTADEYREHAAGFLDKFGSVGREPLDLLAAFASDGCLDKGRVVATPFCFITGSGHQYFLDTARQLMELVTAERVRSTLFGSWTYADEKLSMRWDPIEDRRYALMDRDPTATDNKCRTVWVANLLAYRALALFPSAPRAGYLATTGWDRSAGEPTFTWPIWEHPIGLHAIRSLLLLRELTSGAPDHPALRARGVVATFRARRVQVGRPPLHKINFSPARSV